MSTAGWDALARHVVRARQLGHWRTRRDFANHLGISPRTLDSIEGAKRTSYSRATVTSVEIGLGWAAGSFDRVVAGKRPTRAEDPELERLHQVWPKLSRDARRMLVAVAEIAVDLEPTDDP